MANEVKEHIDSTYTEYVYDCEHDWRYKGMLCDASGLKSQYRCSKCGEIKYVDF